MTRGTMNLSTASAFAGVVAFAAAASKKAVKSLKAKGKSLGGRGFTV